MKFCFMLAHTAVSQVVVIAGAVAAADWFNTSLTEPAATFALVILLPYHERTGPVFCCWEPQHQTRPQGILAFYKTSLPEASG
jgi:hypothetical protein